VFSTPAGEFNNRFVLRFKNSTLANDEFETAANSVIVYTDKNITISSNAMPIKEVVLYDALGRVIAEKKNISDKMTVFENVMPTQNAIIAKVTLENGRVVTKKVIY